MERDPPGGLRVEGPAIGGDPVTLQEERRDRPVILLREAPRRMERHPRADVSVEIGGGREPPQRVRADQGGDDARKRKAVLRIRLGPVAVGLPAVLMGRRPGGPPFIGQPLTLIPMTGRAPTGEDRRPPLGFPLLVCVGRRAREQNEQQQPRRPSPSDRTEDDPPQGPPACRPSLYPLTLCGFPRRNPYRIHPPPHRLDPWPSPPEPTRARRASGRRRPPHTLGSTSIGGRAPIASTARRSSLTRRRMGCWANCSA